MKKNLNLGEHNSQWTSDQENRLISIVNNELGFNHLSLTDNELERVLDEIESKYILEKGKDRNRNSLRIRLKKLQKGILIHCFYEYERFSRDGLKHQWESRVTKVYVTYKPNEIQAIERRKELNNSPLKLFIRHEIKKQERNDDNEQKREEYLVSAGHIGLDWIIKERTAYYVRPKIKGTDYAQMFVDVFTLDRDDSFDEYNILATERSRMYQIDLESPRIPLEKKQTRFSVQIFSELLLTHLIDMTWVMSLDSKNPTITNSWDEVLNLIDRARKGSLITEQAETVIIGFLKKKKEEVLTMDQSQDYPKKVNLDDVYGGDTFNKRNSLVGILSDILSSAEDASPYLRVPPFRIDMPKLFELYTYWLISKMDKGSIKPYICYQKECPLTAFKGLSESGKPKPDFLIKGKGVLIDAKYKVDYSKESYYSNDDVRQLLSYTRLTMVIETCKPQGDIKSVIFYACNGENATIPSSLSDLYNTSNVGVELHPDAIELYKCPTPLPKI